MRCGLGCSKNVIYEDCLHSEGQESVKSNTIETKAPKRPTECKRAPTRPKRKPKASQSAPKGTKREPTNSQKGAEGNQQGPKREPPESAWAPGWIFGATRRYHLCHYNLDKWISIDLGVHFGTIFLQQINRKSMQKPMSEKREISWTCAPTMVQKSIQQIVKFRFVHDRAFSRNPPLQLECLLKAKVGHPQKKTK